MDSRKFGRRVFRVLAVVCVLVVAADLFYPKHGHYAVEDWIGFHAAYGFLSYVGLVLLAKGFRRVVKRDEDYYD